MGYMNVKEGQLKEHNNLQDAIDEAARLSEKLRCKIITVEKIGSAEFQWPENHYKPWTTKLDKDLLHMYMSGGWTPENLGVKFGRTTFAIVCRLEHFRLDAALNRTYRDW